MAAPVRLTVRLTPRAASDRIEGWEADAAGRTYLKVRTCAPPADGRANAALERLVAKALDLPASAVRLHAGGKARIKTLNIDGLDEAGMRRRLGAPI